MKQLPQISDLAILLHILNIFMQFVVKPEIWMALKESSVLQGLSDVVDPFQMHPNSEIAFAAEKLVQSLFSEEDG